MLFFPDATLRLLPACRAAALTHSSEEDGGVWPVWQVAGDSIATFWFLWKYFGF